MTAFQDDPAAAFNPAAAVAAASARPAAVVAAPGDDATPAASPAHSALPDAPREPVDVTVHGDPRVDDYAWLRQRDDPRTLPYLKAENAYSDAWFAVRQPLTDALYAEMLARVKQDDEAVPYRKGGWWYSSRTSTGRQYPVLTRRAAAGAQRHYDAAAPEQVLLDLNELARGKAFLRLGSRALSPDAARLAYTTDETGGRDYVLHVKDLSSDATLPFAMPNVLQAEWAADNRTLYYVTFDATKRADQLWRRTVPLAGEGEPGPAERVYTEVDQQFDIDLRKTLDERYLVVTSSAKDTSETRVIDSRRARIGADGCAGAALRLLLPRRPDIQYDVAHRAGRFYVRINDSGRNFRLVSVADDGATALDLAHAIELVAHRPQVMLADVQAFAHHLVLSERVGGYTQLRVLALDDDPVATTAAAAAASGGPVVDRTADHTLDFDDAVHTVEATGNAEFDTTTLRYTYTSLAEPSATWDYDMATRERTLQKRQPVLGGYDPALYATERVETRAADGTAVPISLIYRPDAGGPQLGQRGKPRPLLLYGYGSYGISIDPEFSLSRVSLLDRGVVFAIAHVRGGGEFGRTWYEAGKLARKANTFTDFIACAEALVAQGWTTPSQLAIEGGSAGGLLMGAVVNLRPDLFRAVIADVPFVDVVDTMLDETIPLTTGEFTEWGNPKIAAQYAWMRAYSPYDNLKPGAYPAMFVRTGLNDSQVAYWEPAKYVAKLRALKTDPNPLLLHVDLDVGHGGASGRFDALKERAQDFVFILQALGLAD